MKRFLDVCFSDGLACSSSVKGVGVDFEACIKSWGDRVRICPRLSDVSLLESSIRDGGGSGEGLRDLTDLEWLTLKSRQGS